MKPVMVRPPEPLEAAFETMVAKGVSAVVMQGTTTSKASVDLAMVHRLPAFGTTRELPATGGLMGYFAKSDELYRETAGYIDKVLKGARPANLPVSFPAKFELVINLTTAKALGLTLPATLLARADELID